MKTNYSSAKEIAELYISSSLKDKTDVSVLINESAKMLMAKIGKEKAMAVCMLFLKNKEALYTVAGLENYLNCIGVESISFADPITNKIESTVYINLKN